MRKTIIAAFLLAFSLGWTVFAEDQYDMADLQYQLKGLTNGESEDHFRLIDGVTNYDRDFPNIGGKVLQVTDDGLLIITEEWSGDSMLYTGPTVLLINYPLRVVDDDKIAFYAKEIGTYSYESVSGATHTIKKYDYGTSVMPSREMLDAKIDEITKRLDPYADERKALAQKQEEKLKSDKIKEDSAKRAANANALRLNEEDAARGDEYGLLRMGQRYRDGDGVEKDLKKAKEYLKKAADAGSPTAVEELSRLQ